MPDGTPQAAEIPERRRQPALRWLRHLAWLLVPLAVAGELGHHVLERLGHLVAHHWFHIAFAGGAVVLFLGYVIADVRRHGWPSFTWRLRAAEREAPPAVTRPR